MHLFSYFPISYCCGYFIFLVCFISYSLYYLYLAMSSSSTSPQKVSWHRPGLPQIFRRSTIRNSNTGESYNIRIQEIPSYRYGEFYDMFREHFYTDEPVHQSINMTTDEERMSFVEQDDYGMLSRNMSVIAVLDSDDPKPTILGGLLLTIIFKSDPSREPHKASSKSTSVVEAYCYKLNALLKWMRIDDNIFEEFETDRLLKDSGLVVKREYRGMGIGLELFRTVECIAEKYGFPGLAVMLSHPASRKIGVKLGITQLKEGRLVDCEDDESGQKVFPDADPEITIVSGYIKYDLKRVHE